MLKSSLPFLVLAAVAMTSSAQDPENSSKSNRVVLEYLGTAGWKISDGTTVILVDPYLSRINGPAPPGAGSSGSRDPHDARPILGWNDVPTVDVATIDSHIPRADYVLVTHTHYDHVLDVPHIALRHHSAVIGTESTENVLRAYRVPEEQLITVRGGEDYEFAQFSLKVIPSIHSPLDHKRYFSSETAPAGMQAPLTLQQVHPEGGTLAYLIRFHGHQILAFGGNNFIEREIAGLRPDVVLIGAGASHKEIHDYTRRLLSNLGFPALVIPTHWDNFLVPYSVSQQPSISNLQPFLEEVRAASPKSKIIVPQYFEPIPLQPVKQ